MMRGVSVFVFAVFFLLACEEHSAYTQTAKLYKTLDSLIEHHDEIINAKEKQITALSSSLHSVNLTPEQEYNINLRLYDEYMAFCFDSAYHYINRNLQNKFTLSDPERFAISAIRMAHILSVSGIYENARHLLNNIETSQLSDKTNIAYYNQLAELNLYQAEMTQNTPYFRQYIDSAQYYRQRVMQIAPKESYDYITNYANFICEQGNIYDAIRLSEDYLPKLRSGDRHYSITTSTLAYFYKKKGQPKEQEYYLLLSAISDLRGAIVENNSLRELASVLMERGEYEHAYQFLSLASNDAQLYGSGLRSIQAARLAPFISKAYDAQRKQAQQRTNRLLVIISLIVLLLFCFILFTFWLLHKHHIANRKIRQMNAELSLHNDEMKNINGQMIRLNNEMKEANRIKEEYIGRFLELCSTLVHRGEERIKLFNRLARERKLENLYTELKNISYINEGIHMFHQNFDTAFLNIFPKFIREVNLLLTPDSQFEVAEDSTRLTTELRILALIRLGITDNQKIADILRSSITTIYTYRSKIRSRALQKETFEDDIKKIATY